MRRNQTDPVFDWLAYHAEFDPGRLAAFDLATQRWLTYGEFNDRATRLATALRERFGVEQKVRYLHHRAQSEGAWRPYRRNHDPLAGLCDGRLRLFPG